MTLIPGPRTHPTVKSLAQTNQRSLRSWQISLGAPHVSLLLGGILGSLACAFYLGFFSGQKIGIEMALSNNLSSAMRLPLGSDDEAPLGADEALTDVYAKLNQLDAPAEPMLPQANGLSDSNDAIGSAAFGALDSTSAKAKPSLGSIAPHDESDPTFGALEKALNDTPLNDTEQAGRPTELAGSKALANAASAGLETAGGGIHLQPAEPAGSTSAATGAKEKTLGALAADSDSRDAAALARTQLAKEKEQAAKELAAKQLAAKESAAKIALAKEQAAKELAAKESAARETAVQQAALKKAETEKQKSPTALNGSGLVRDTLPRGWFAQVAAPDNRAEAESLARKLQKSGFQVMIENAKVRGQEYFRVLVGPEDTRQQSERLLAQLKREPGLKADPFIRMVR